jgi:hypothetical protein
MRQCGEERDSLYYLNEFVSIKKRTNEAIDYFNKNFSNLYNKLPIDINPSQPAVKVTYVGAFDADFSMNLRERRYSTLLLMQDEIETGKMK